MSLLLNIKTTKNKIEVSAIEQKTISDIVRSINLIPLIDESRNQVINVYKLNKDQNVILKSNADDFRYRVLSRRYRRDIDELKIPVIGEIFYTPDNKGIGYLACIPTGSTGMMIWGDDKSQGQVKLEIGIFGKDNYQEIITKLQSKCSEIILKDIEWDTYVPKNIKFEKLIKDKKPSFEISSVISEDEIRISSILSEEKIRETANVIKRSGSILHKDLHEKYKKNKEKFNSIIDILTQEALIEEDFVIICKKTSNQINRVKCKKDLEQLYKLDIKCITKHLS